MAGEGRVSNSALQLEIKIVGNSIEDVKSLLVNYEERIRCLERAGDKTTPLIEKRLETLEKLTEAHAKELEELKKLITIQAQSIEKLTISFETMQKIWKWALGIFTVVMTAVIIMLVTGQALVVFK
jgi:hypothetical protein